MQMGVSGTRLEPLKRCSDGSTAAPRKAHGQTQTFGASLGVFLEFLEEADIVFFHFPF